MTARERRQRKALARGGSGAEGADGSAPEPGMGGGKKKKAAGSAVRRSTPCDQPFAAAPLTAIVSAAGAPAGQKGQAEEAER